MKCHCRRTAGRFVQHPAAAHPRDDVLKKYAKIFEQIEEEIKTNLLYESDFWPMTEEALARRFNVSRMPIRRVVSNLERENLIVRRNKIGTSPRVPDLDEMIDICEIRILIEPKITARAVENMTEDSIETLRNRVRDCARYNSEGNKRLAAYHDLKFHHTLAKLSRNAHAAAILESLSILTRIFIAFSKENPIHMDRSPNPHSHERILTHVEERNPQQAELKMSDHLKWMARKLKERKES